MSGRVEFNLNAQKEIVSVGHEWDRFALENGAPELTGDKVIGRPLLDFVTGNVTRQFVMALLDLVQHGKPAIELDYRCDSPRERRFMRMRVARLATGEIHFLHQTLRTELRDHRVYIATAKQRSRHTPIRCSMCNLIKPAHHWVEPDQLPFRERGSKSEILVIYGICNSCAAQLHDLVDPKIATLN
jgi:hypothetical protein